MGWFLMLMAIRAGAGVSDQQIAQMFVLGFEGRHLTRSSSIVKDVCDRGLGGVILFKKNVQDRSQLRALTAQLSQCKHWPLIAVDQEGGKVRRIRFGRDYPRAEEAVRMGTRRAAAMYDAMAQELHDLGINYNLAPVADLATNPQNYIIAKLGRSYGRDPGTVTTYDTLFIRAMHRHKIATALKHFPGHGSSRGDTHQGFVDVTQTWSPRELEPFWNSRADSVMIAHVGNDRIGDPGIPASLSPRAIRTLRRRHPHVVAITDDLQMGAIRKHYSLKETLRRAINAGNDLLLFGNQLSRDHRVTLTQLTGIVRQLIASGQVRPAMIQAANRRIARLRRTIGAPRRTPTVSTPKRSVPHHRTTTPRATSRPSKRHRRSTPAAAALSEDGNMF
jgi:beta-N-acetylhexosaminidase